MEKFYNQGKKSQERIVNEKNGVIQSTSSTVLPSLLTTIGQFFKYLQFDINEDKNLSKKQVEEILSRPSCFPELIISEEDSTGNVDEQNFILDNHSLCYLWNLKAVQAFLSWFESSNDYNILYFNI